MSVSRQEDPRANQKERTRSALIAAAEELLRRGTPPTVAEAAEHAKVSRATAYRYFPTQDSMLLEVAEINPAVKPIDELVAQLSGDDVEARMLQLQDKFNRFALDNEVAMRSLLQASLGVWLANRNGKDHLPVRQGRRVRWLDKVLEPLKEKLTKRQLQRLRAALALTLSVEALIIMKDVCRLDDAEALATLRWTAQTLLRSGLR
ncbi:MAG TPA: helix-turn-helix domain-containing protein [Terriglobales bacterium]|nr:helix-turn-helix domain-containing protein [Terriglobales bacterium]